MVHGAEFSEANSQYTNENARRQKDNGHDAERQLAARFLDDIAGKKDVGAGKSSSTTDTKVVATGAKVDTDKNGLVRDIGRTDGSEIVPRYSNDKNKRLESFTAVAPDKSKVVYKRDADSEAFKAYTTDGKLVANVGSISKVEFSANGNMSFLDQNNNKVIVRGNGGVLPVGLGKFDVNFDTEGRIKKITPSDEALAQGASIREYDYKEKTEELAQIKVDCPARNPGFVFTHSLNDETKQWECHDQNGESYSTSQDRRALAKNGELVYENSVHAGDKMLSRVIYPNGMEELKKGDILPNGYHVNTAWDANGKFVGMQTFAPVQDKEGNIVKDKDGKTLEGLPGKRYIAIPQENGKPRIIESDPLTGTEIKWDQQNENSKNVESKFTGEVVFTGPNSPYKKGQKLERSDIDFKENGQVTYKDEKGTRYTEFHDSKKIELTDGSTLFPDNRGNMLRAMKDSQNYLDYVWKDSDNGKKELSKVISVVDGVKKEAWSASDKAGVVQPDGRFSYEGKDGKIAFIDLDSTITKYQVGKDEKGPTLTPVEISLTNGAKRVIEPGEDIEHPKRIVDTFTDADGRNMQRTLKALPVVTSANELAAHNQRMQMYELTEEHLSNANFNQPGTTPRTTMQATVTDLEVLKNGDILATAPVNAKNPFQPFDGMRFEFKAKNMPESIVPSNKPNTSPPKSMKPLDADTRLAQAKDKFEKIFAKEIAPRLPARSDRQANSAGLFMTETLLLPETKNGEQQGAEATVHAKNIAAYRYELGSAIIHQQKVDAEAWLGKR